MLDVQIIKLVVYVYATSNVTSEVDIDLERLILDIINLKLGMYQIHFFTGFRIPDIPGYQIPPDSR